MMTPDISTLQEVVKRLQIETHFYIEKAKSSTSSYFNATAQVCTDIESIYGFGAGNSEDIAMQRAVMECVERYAQFQPNVSTPTIIQSYASLQENAILPTACGLYSHAQYTASDFKCVPFSEQMPLQWLEVSEVATNNTKLIPIEFIYPRAYLNRSPIVIETSSGTAAHFHKDTAILLAICEVIERDSLMFFWYRQPPTATISIEVIPVYTLRQELRKIQNLGFVVTVCYLTYDLDIPCFLVIALKGNSFIYGLGCHPDWFHALSHAVVELSQSLFSQRRTPPWELKHQSLPQVKTPEDHYALYNKGFLNPVLRQFLAQVLHSQKPQDSSILFQQHFNEKEYLNHILQTLGKLGYRIYICDITPQNLADSGIHVIRTLIPGLIPIHFGYNSLRMGCRRLWSNNYSGRLSTLLPHFMH
ncbi:MAG: YcaO-like family protein [Calothrix sp. C42_A2020_038]|nr:YcaO-like family protein [Calothrix sp. C42_A2020_038]